MKYIYIITQFSTANDYGIGSYYKSLGKIFSNTILYKVIYIELYSENELLSVENNLIRIPKPRSLNKTISDLDERYFYSVSLVLASIIKDIDSVYFFVNHSHHCQMIKFMKSMFNKSKFVLVLHYLSWVWELKGNTILYKKILSNPSEFCQSHGYILNLYNKDIEYFKTVDAIVTLSIDTFSLFGDIYKLNDQKIFMIPNGVDIKNFELSKLDRSNLRSSMHIQDSDCILLYVGRFEELKGIDKLIVSFKRVLLRNKNCKLIIVGDGDFSYLLSLCKGDNCNIIFTGKIDHEYLNLLYQISDIGIIPSYSEECSYVALEMKMNRMRIISSDGRGLKSMFRNDNNAIIAEIVDYENDLYYIRNLEESIIKMIESCCLKRKPLNNCDIKFPLNYTFDNMKELYEDMINEL